MVARIKNYSNWNSGKFAYVGGNWNNGLNAGAFYFNLNNSASNSNTNIGASLSFLDYTHNNNICCSHGAKASS